jgi:hypothetical protein
MLAEKRTKSAEIREKNMMKEKYNHYQLTIQGVKVSGHPESKYHLAVKKYILDVKIVYSLLSNSTYLNLHFDGSITHTEALVVMGHKVFYALFVQVGNQTGMSLFSMLSSNSSSLWKILPARNLFRWRNR